MADIFKEIDEDLRRDRAAELWRRYRWPVVVLVVLVVGGAAGFVLWQNHQRSRSEKLGVSFAADAALADTDAAKATAAFKTLGDGGAEGYRLLARFRAASLEAKGADRAAGIAAYKAIAADDSVVPAYRDLATLLAALNGIDSAKPSDIIAAVQPLTIAPNPWRFSALELTALARLKSGDRAAALKIYQQITDDLEAPPSLRARAAEIVGALGHQG